MSKELLYIIAIYAVSTIMAIAAQTLTFVWLRQ